MGEPPVPFVAAFKNALRPKKYRTVSQWADENRWLEPKNTSRPGKWRTSIMPFLREPMDALSENSPVQDLTLMFPSQTGGKTEVILNWAGYVADDAPAQMMIVQPTIHDAEKFSKSRVRSLIDSSPVLSGIFGSNKSRDGSNTILIKEYPAGSLMMTGSNSPSSMASTPVRNVAVDELDRCSEDAGGEGSALDIVGKRMSSFPDSKMLKVSTPTIAGKSAIEKEYLRGDQRKYFVPCPHCGWKQELVFDNLVWDGEINNIHNVGYMCSDCGTLIEEHNKTWMLAEKGYGGDAEWVPTVTGIPDSIRSYHLNALYAPLGLKVTWPLLIREFLEAKDDAMKMRVFKNTRMAETFALTGERPDEEKIWLRRESYARGTAPVGSAIITAGVDVQKDRLEMEVVAWGRRMESWSVDYHVFYGDTQTDAPWNQMFSLFENGIIKHENGHDMKIRTVAVDSGYMTSEVYRRCSAYSPSRVMIIKGRDNQNKTISQTRVSIKRNGVIIGGEVSLFNIGTNILKEQFYGWLGQPMPDTSKGEELPPGWCHFPEYDQDHFKGLCSEAMVAKTVRGRMAYAWEKIYNRNEQLDCRIYALVAAILNGVDSWSDARWDQELQMFSSEASTGQPQRSSMRAKPRRHESSWLKS